MKAENKDKLTVSVVKAATYKGVDGERYVIWDSEIPGFGLRVYPTGKKAFIISYRSEGRKHLMTLEGSNVLTADQARKLAKQLLAAASRGENPLADQQRKNSGETMAHLCKAFMDRHAKQRKKTWKDDAQRIKDYILPSWANHQIKSINYSDVALLHSNIRSKRHGKHSAYCSNKTVALLSVMFEKAKKWGMLDKTAPNPAKGIEKFKEKKRNRWLKPEEMQRLFESIGTEENLYAKYAIFLYLLTGTRRSELLKLKWTNVDLKRQVIMLESTKAGNDHFVALSSPAVALFQSIPKVAGNPYVFVGRVKGKPLVNISKPWNRMRKKAKIEDVWIHDLRRTVGSWMAQSNKSLHLIGRVLNHSTVSTTQRYAHLADDHARAALEEHGEQVLALTGAADITDIIEVQSDRR